MPLCWHLLDNRSGNSNAADRIAVLAHCVPLLGRERIELVVGDREFIGPGSSGSRTTAWTSSCGCPSTTA